jgi:hypothetical protein
MAHQGAEVSEAIQLLSLEDAKKVHSKIPNPFEFPLPRPGNLILGGNVHKEVLDYRHLPALS